MNNQTNNSKRPLYTAPPPEKFSSVSKTPKNPNFIQNSSSETYQVYTNNPLSASTNSNTTTSDLTSINNNTFNITPKKSQQAGLRFTNSFSDNSSKPVAVSVVRPPPPKIENQRLSQVGSYSPKFPKMNPPPPKINLPPSKMNPPPLKTKPPPHKIEVFNANDFDRFENLYPTEENSQNKNDAFNPSPEVEINSSKSNYQLGSSSPISENRSQTDPDSSKTSSLSKSEKSKKGFWTNCTTHFKFGKKKLIFCSNIWKSF